MNPISHVARTDFRASFPGFRVAVDEQGRTGFTRLHEKGHLNTRAAIANVLGHAAKARTYPSDHAIYIDRVRQLRKRGTWM